MRKLQTLNLGYNSLSGSLPQLGSQALRFVYLNNNNLTGPLPATIGDAVNLVYLDLSQNDLQGDIPSELGNCIHLEHLFLGDNYFGGLLPDLGNLKDLAQLELQNNPFTPDVVPEWLFKLWSLTDLWMNNTQRTGSMPADIAKFGSLGRIDFGYNHLTGNFPGGWDWGIVFVLQFEFNLFSGLCPSLDGIDDTRNCDLSNIPFSCPLPAGAREICNAYCE